MDERTLANVLVPAGGNALRLADVHFDRVIQHIAPRSELVEWRDIATRDRWRDFVTRYCKPPSSAAAEGGGLLLIPGAVDTHVHFNTPGYEHREDFEHGSHAAACGGVTVVADMPCTSIPPVTSCAALNAKLTALQTRSTVDFALWGGISSQVLHSERAEHDIRDLAEAGVIGFKCYMTSGMESFGDLSASELLRAAWLTKEVGLPLAVHAEERSLVRERERESRAASRHDWQAYAESRDTTAEAVAVAILREIARATGAAIHIVHLSSECALEIVAEAQREGLQFTAETCPHYLQFTADDFARAEIAAFLKTAPPVKSAADRAALWSGLCDGTLAFVTTDHAGCDPSVEKSPADFWEVYGGIPGVEHRVPFLLSEGFCKGRLTLERTIELLCTAPARFLGMARQKGQLESGMDADLALVDLWSDETVTAAKMHSKGKYTPFEGMTFRARVTRTWLRGEVAHAADESAAVMSCRGQWLKREPQS